MTPSTPGRSIRLPLSVAEVDRAAHLRTDEKYLQKAWQDAFVLQFNDEKFVTKSHQLAIVLGSQLGDYKPESDYFLGVNKLPNGAVENFFVRNLGVINSVIDPEQNLEPQESSISKDESLKSLREIGSYLSPRDIGLAVHAQGLANWHKKHTRCPQCGAATSVISGGSVRKCLIDESEHYPRTDSAIIVLVKDDQDRVLLGRQKVWPKNRFSTFAGFVEPGESFEHCVVREVSEEAGVLLSNINYLGSQPWPFPSSLMIAFEAITTNPESARPDGEEIEEIRWFSRADMKAAIAGNSLILPLEISVARQMINSWYGDSAASDLKGNESWR